MQLTRATYTSRYPILTPQFYSDMLRALLERSFESREWGLNSPPKPHAFVSLPVQSSLYITYLTEFFAYIRLFMYNNRVLFLALLVSLIIILVLTVSADPLLLMDPLSDPMPRVRCPHC